MSGARLTTSGLLALASFLAGCSAADSRGEVPAAAIADEATSTTRATASMAEFIAAADEACRAVWPKVAALPDADGVGGQKQIGLGTIVRLWAEELAAINAPPDIAADWLEATELLRMSGVKLEESEQLAAAGDPTAGEAQSEALWSLQPRASEIILALDIPFQACSFE